MATFTILAKICSTEYFCNTKVAGVGEMFVQQIFWLYGTIIWLFHGEVIMKVSKHDCDNVFILHEDIPSDRVIDRKRPNIWEPSNFIFKLYNLPHSTALYMYK